VLDDLAISREHARIVRGADGCWLTDTSTNGTAVNDVVIKATHRLQHGDQVRMGPVVFKFLSGANIETEYHEDIYRSVSTDFLTNLTARKIFDDELSREIMRAHRHRRPLSLVMMDIDHFKKINDTLGHDGGDEVLKAVAKLVKAHVRATDVAARLGGEELGILMPETTCEAAATLAERIRKALALTPIVLRTGPISVTASFGCAELETEEDAEALYRRADGKMYESKNGGRNRVTR
jgi:two-component system, cell cycle response regulator